MPTNNTKYFICNKDRVIQGSNLAHRLSRPKQVDECEHDVTKYTFGWIIHPESGNCCAKIDVNATIPIHQFIRDSVANNNGVSPYFDQFYLTLEEATEKKNLVVNSFDEEGGLVVNIKVTDIIPSDWEEVNLEYLENNGWFSGDLEE
jgi:hypothetical protein